MLTIFKTIVIIALISSFCQQNIIKYVNLIKVYTINTIITTKKMRDINETHPFFFIKTTSFFQINLESTRKIKD